MKVRQDPRWPRAHEGLRKLYEERVPDGMSQAEFGAEYGLGTQGMVWQYLNGYTPLNYDAAAKFAKGLRCMIRDFSPEMSDALEAEIIPVLGRRARRVAVLALLATTMSSGLAPERAAQEGNFVVSLACLHIMSNARRLYLIALRLLSSGKWRAPCQVLPQRNSAFS
jgi:transcriptional regulator with XRE-family HTH domain